MESQLGLMLKQSWYLKMGPLMVLMLTSLWDYFLKTHLYLLKVKFLNMMRESNWDFHAKVLGTIIGNVYGIKLGHDVRT